MLIQHPKAEQHKYSRHQHMKEILFTHRMNGRKFTQNAILYNDTITEGTSN